MVMKTGGQPLLVEHMSQVSKVTAESFTNKPLHVYVRKKIMKNENVDQKITDQWRNCKYNSSHFEAYTCTIHEQDVERN